MRPGLAHLKKITLTQFSFIDPSIAHKTFYIIGPDHENDNRAIFGRFYYYIGGDLTDFKKFVFGQQKMSCTQIVSGRLKAPHIYCQTAGYLIFGKLLLPAP